MKSLLQHNSRLPMALPLTMRVKTFEIKTASVRNQSVSNKLKNIPDAGKSSKRPENSKNKSNVSNIHEARDDTDLVPGNPDQVLGKSKKSPDSLNEFFNLRTDSRKPGNRTESRSIPSIGK